MLALTGLSLHGQSSEKGTLYIAEFWIDYKGNNNDFVKAMKNRKFEKVEILKTEKFIKVTFGTKVSKYLIKSSNPFSQARLDCNVVSNNIEYTLSIIDMTIIKPDAEFHYMISFSKKGDTDNSIWSVSQIKESQEVNIN